MCLAISNPKIWLRDITKKEPEIWITENKISLDATLRMSLPRMLNNISDNDKPFQASFY